MRKTYGERMRDLEFQQDEAYWNRQMAHAIRDNDEKEVEELIEEGTSCEYQLHCSFENVRSAKISSMLEEYAYN